MPGQNIRPHTRQPSPDTTESSMRCMATMPNRPWGCPTVPESPSSLGPQVCFTPVQPESPSNIYCYSLIPFHLLWLVWACKNTPEKLEIGYVWMNSFPALISYSLFGPSSIYTYCCRRIFSGCCKKVDHIKQLRMSFDQSAWCFVFTLFAPNFCVFYWLFYLWQPNISSQNPAPFCAIPSPPTSYSGSEMALERDHTPSIWATSEA